MTTCLVCETSIEPFLSFGKMPISQAFLTPDQFENEYFYELKVAFCAHCGMVQLTELIDREKMFHDEYPFYSSTSTRMTAHFKALAEQVIVDYVRSFDPFVIEIGSNDGIMLQHFANADIRHLGIEPSANVAQMAIDKGVRTICEFFDENLASKIVAEHGQADAFLGANVMCHIPYLHSVAAGIKILLKPAGVLVFEDPYLGDIIEKTSFDQIYDEHAFYFCVGSINYFFEQHGLKVVDVVPQSVHGGSMRYVIAHQEGPHPVSDAVTAQLAKEWELGLHRPGTYDQFRRRVERSRDELVSLLQDLNRRGKRVVGYAATAKSATSINYCGITPDLVEFISDITPIKQGKFTPGAHIPVRPHQDFASNYPDYALLFAWNHAEEIMAKEKEFRQSGGKWIVYVPKVRVLE